MRRPSRSAALVRPVCLLFLLVCALLSPKSVSATSYLIATTADETTVNGNCTLREAIRAADTNAAVDACPAGTVTDVITLPTQTYPFSGHETLFGSGSLTIQSQTLNPFNVTIDLGGVGRFLLLSGSAAITLGGLEIANGFAPPADPVGGAIYAGQGSLTVFNFRFLSNVATGGGGAVFYSATSPGNKLQIHNGAFISNSVTGSLVSPSAGGAAYISVQNGADADIRDVSFISSSLSASVFEVAGGALYLASAAAGSAAACSRCTFSSNSAASTAPSGSNAVHGGAVNASALSGSQTELTDCRFTGNAATGPSAAQKVSAIYGRADAGGTVVMNRLFVDFNGGASDLLTRDVELRGVDSVSFVGLIDSQVTFGSANGLVVTADSVAQVLLGHLTIADYPLTGANLTVFGGTGVLMENSIVALNGTNLTTAGKVGLSANYVGNSPGFLDEPNGDYHLDAASTAIGTGSNAAVSLRFADLDHRPRIVGAVTDRGCYEFDGLFADNFDVGDAGSWSLSVP